MRFQAKRTGEGGCSFFLAFGREKKPSFAAKAGIIDPFQIFAGAQQPEPMVFGESRLQLKMAILGVKNHCAACGGESERKRKKAYLLGHGGSFSSFELNGFAAGLIIRLSWANEKEEKLSPASRRSLSTRALERLRKRIDALDRRLVSLLNERAKAVLEIKRVKDADQVSAYVPAREAQVLRRVAGRSRGPLPPTALQAVFREIMSASLALEGNLRVAYLGPKATNTHLAAVKKFGSSVLQKPVPSLRDVFLEVERGRVDFGVVPVENSTEGIVNHTLDLFVDFELKICSEIVLPISHTLMSKTGRLDEVKKVFSHPQALAQCRLWLETNLPGVKVVETASTARAAQLAAQHRGTAAVAPELAAKLYGLKAIARRIEDVGDNITRFFVIGRNWAERTGKDKTSVMVSIKDKVGALYRLLLPFQRRRINLTSIESRPSRRKAWDYYFFIDFEGHVADASVRRALSDLEKESLFVRILGSYPRSEESYDG